MELRFAKWHGTGNDFILIDDREGIFPVTDELVRRLCDRHFGIGSDGLILIQGSHEAGADFHMEFFNPDASRSFCGNGSRCAFAFWSGLIGARGPAAFTAIDGLHQGEWRDGLVAVTLRDVAMIKRGSDGESVDFIHNGSERRYAPAHAPGGTNVNFLRVANGTVEMRTYERGVEAETLSCGTGVVAAALSALDRGSVRAPVRVSTPGGTLTVEARLDAEGAKDIRLIGPVSYVFNGAVSI